MPPESAVALGSAERRFARPGRSTRTASIVGLGTALPQRVVTNAELTAELGVSDDWIVRRTGIHERRHAEPGQLVSDLAVAAARAALDDAELGASELDMILIATVASDDITPACAPVVAHELGVGHAAAFDVGAACTGTLAALSHATAAIEADRARNVLVVGAEILSRFIDFEDRRTAHLFGDGAGALVVSAQGGGEIGPFVFGSDGGAAHAIRAPRALGKLEMDGHDTFIGAVNHLSECTVELAERSGIELADIDLFVYHQANSRILTAVAERLELEPGRVFDCIARIGNTSAASVPLALARAREEGLLEPGSQVLLGAIGAGMVWGATITSWGRG